MHEAYFVTDRNSSDHQHYRLKQNRILTTMNNLYFASIATKFPWGPITKNMIDERRSCYFSKPSSKTTVRVMHVVFQVEFHVRDDCMMTMVMCPYEGAGCAFHVSSVLIQRFCNPFMVQLINLNNHKGQTQTSKNKK